MSVIELETDLRKTLLEIVQLPLPIQSIGRVTDFQAICCNLRVKPENLLYIVGTYGWLYK